MNNKNTAILFSGGKDSVYATLIAQNKGYEVKCLITLISENDYSWMFHTPNIKFTKVQAKCLDIPLMTFKTKGKKEKELIDLENALKIAKEKHKLKYVFTGAVWSEYQRSRISKICKKLNLEVKNPAWQKDQSEYMQELINAGIKLIFSAVAAYGLNKNWVGKEIDSAALKKLNLLNEKIGLNVCGEGGEFESTVLDAPNYKQRIEILDKEIKEISENEARLVIKDYKLIKK
jgi:asparagine synthase (glutamine-hydrolysing)